MSSQVLDFVLGIRPDPVVGSAGEQAAQREMCESRGDTSQCLG
jgi:hypothetical protein